MLQLRINNQPLDLFPNTRMPLAEYSPIFDRDAIQRSFSFPIKVPTTIRNKKLLQYASRIDGAGARKYSYAELRVAGQQYEQGTIVITGSGRDEIEIAFKSEILELIENLNNFRIRSDLSIPVVATPGFLPPFQIRLDLDAVDEAARIVPLEVNGNYYSEPAEFTNDFVNQINTDFPGLTTLIAYNSSEVIIEFDPSAKPDVFIRLFPLDLIPNDEIALISELFRYYENDFLDEQAYIDDYATHVNDVQAGNVSTHTFPTIYAPNFYDKDNAAWKGYVNHVDEAGDISLTLRTLAEEAEYNLVPMPYLQTVFESIFAKAGPVTVGGTFFQDADLAKLIVYNNRSIETSITKTVFVADKTRISNIDDRIFIGYLATYELQDHCPDLTFYEFIQKIGTMFPVVYKLNGGTIEVSTVNQLLGTATLDLTSYSLEEWKKRYTRYSGYELTYERYDTPEEDPAYLQDLSGGTDEDETLRLRSDFFTHYFRDITDSTTTDVDGLNGRAWRVPIDPFEGYSLPGNASSEIDLRLLFYFGDQPDSESNNYPYASFLPENYAGTSTGAYSLEWDGDKGLYRQHWQKYIDLLQSDELTIQILLPIQKIIELKQNITTAVYVRHPDGSFRGLIKKLNFSVGIDTDHMILCTAQIAKL